MTSSWEKMSSFFLNHIKHTYETALLPLSPNINHLKYWGWEPNASSNAFIENKILLKFEGSFFLKGQPNHNSMIIDDNSLVPNRRPAITWTYADPVYWYIYATVSLGLKYIQVAVLISIATVTVTVTGALLVSILTSNAPGQWLCLQMS